MDNLKRILGIENRIKELEREKHSKRDERLFARM